MLKKENWRIRLKCFYISDFIPEEVEILEVYKIDDSFAEFKIDLESNYDPFTFVIFDELYLTFDEAFEVAQNNLFEIQKKLNLIKK
jgi:hypothetical protein